MEIDPWLVILILLRTLQLRLGEEESGILTA
jgi:hypothetical protein